MVVIPVPPPSALSTDGEGSGERLPISSRARNSGGGESNSWGAGGEGARGLDEVLDKGRDERRGGFGVGAGSEKSNVPLLVRNFRGSKASLGAGLAASITRGSVCRLPTRRGSLTIGA